MRPSRASTSSSVATDAADLVAGHHRQVVEGEHVRGVGGGDQQDVLVEEGDRHRAVLAQHRGVDQRGGALVDGIVVQVHVLDAVALGDSAGELVRGDDAALEQGLAGGAAGLARLDHGAFHRLALAKSCSTMMSPIRRMPGPGARACGAAGAVPWVVTLRISAIRPYG